MKHLLSFLPLLIPFLAVANDGVYYANGNHLIPITETDISVRKEVLTITRMGDQFHVDVYYEFFNPAQAKTLLVGFEAADPYPGYPPDIYVKAYPNHPYISNFTVEMNGKPLNYQVAHVNFSSGDWVKRPRLPKYYHDGQIDTVNFQANLAVLRDSDWAMNASIDYAYHFLAHFQPGLNIIHHTYQYKVSAVAGYDYYLHYVLTAANRWANHQIDDFTLILDMGDCQSFVVDPSFYNAIDEWQIEGAGRKNTHKDTHLDIGPKAWAMFHIRHGKAVFHKANFHPNGELQLYGTYYLYIHSSITKEEYFSIVAERYFCPWRRLQQDKYPFDLKALPFTRDERRILRNIPFAYRGYCFKNKDLQAFFSSTDWYLPDSTYTPDLEALTPEERRWIQLWAE